MGYADCHLHMTDPGFAGVSEGAELLFSCTARPCEWEMLRDLEDGRLLRFYGTHPWYPGECDTEGLKSLLETDGSAGVGEIGLDAARLDYDTQMRIFTEQIGIASKYDRIVNIHMIRSEETMLKILRRERARCILHSFSGPESYIRPFTECGCYFSISPRLLNKSKEKILALVSKIPEDRLLIETDAPNSRLSMDGHILRLSGMMSMSPDELRRITLRNARSLMG